MIVRNMMMQGGYLYDPNMWIDKMLISYFDTINSHFDSTSRAAYLPVLQARLQPTYADSATTGYLYNTFGPGGQNKTVCDFVFLLSCSGNIATRAFSKTGATLRWNLDGTIASQNDLPNYTKGTNAGFISCSTTDNFTSISTFQLFTNTFRYNIPKIAFSNPISFVYIYGNAFTGTFPYTIGFNTLRMYSNQFSGQLMHGGLGQEITAQTNLLTGYSVYNFSVAGRTYNLSGNAFTTAKVDEYLSAMNTFFISNAPTGNLTLNLSGATMGIPTGGASNTALVNIVAIFTGAGRVATIIIRIS